MRTKPLLFVSAMLLIFLSACREENTTSSQLPMLEVNAVAEELEETDDDTLAALTNDETIRFNPLGDNERFAYSLENVQTHSPYQRRWDMTLYAVQNGDTANAVELFSWENVETNRVQFTSDLRKCFFLTRRGSTWTFDLYVADGLTGEVRKLLADTVGSLFRVSEDGKFVGFLSRHHAHDSVTIFLFDVKAGVMAGEFEWRPEHYPIAPGWGIFGGWSIFRFNNVFRVAGLSEGSAIITAIELDLTTMELRTLFDETDADRNTPRSPLTLLWNGDYFNIDWEDDVRRQSRDPNIRLRR